MTPKEQLDIVRQRQEFVCLEDGYWYYWQSRDFPGAISSYELRVIADELDRLNAPWDKQVKEELERLNK